MLPLCTVSLSLKRTYYSWLNAHGQNERRKGHHVTSNYDWNLQDSQESREQISNVEAPYGLQPSTSSSHLQSL